MTGVIKYATDITHAKEVKREADSMATYTSASVEQMKAAIADIARSITTGIPWSRLPVRRNPSEA